MTFELIFTDEASINYDDLENNKAQLKQFKAVRKALAYLEINPKHPSLNTHQYESLAGPNKEKVFEAYAENKTQNKTPGAYRIFWYYGPNKKQITIMAIVPHP